MHAFLPRITQTETCWPIATIHAGLHDGGLGAVLDEYEATQRAYEHTMKKQKAGKQTDFAASLGLDTTQINMAGVRHAQRAPGEGCEGRRRDVHAVLSKPCPSGSEPDASSHQ